MVDRGHRVLHHCGIHLLHVLCHFGHWCEYNSPQSRILLPKPSLSLLPHSSSGLHHRRPALLAPLPRKAKSTSRHKLLTLSVEIVGCLQADCLQPLCRSTPLTYGYLYFQYNWILDGDGPRLKEVRSNLSPIGFILACYCTCLVGRHYSRSVSFWRSREVQTCDCYFFSPSNHIPCSELSFQMGWPIVRPNSYFIQP